MRDYYIKSNFKIRLLFQYSPGWDTERSISSNSICQNLPPIKTPQYFSSRVHITILTTETLPNFSLNSRPDFDIQVSLADNNQCLFDCFYRIKLKNLDNENRIQHSSWRAIENLKHIHHLRVLHCQNQKNARIFSYI